MFKNNLTLMGRGPYPLACKPYGLEAKPEPEPLNAYPFYIPAIRVVPIEPGQSSRSATEIPIYRETPRNLS